MSKSDDLEHVLGVYGRNIQNGKLEAANTFKIVSFSERKKDYPSRFNYHHFGFWKRTILWPVSLVSGYAIRNWDFFSFSADDKLLKVFNECKEGKMRMAKVVVKNEKLCVTLQDKGTADWRADFRRNLPACIDAFEPCYILFRIDDPTKWLLISFADDRAPVREKMVFAATEAAFKSEFGLFNIGYDYHVTNKKEMTLEAFDRWLSDREKPGPMSDLEKEMHDAYQKEKSNSFPHPVQAVKGVSLPVDQDANMELKKLVEHKVNFVQLAIDTLNEAIKLEASKMLSTVEELKELIPTDKPRYHFYRFSHQFDNEDCETMFFIYTIPPSGSTIKERMLYSSCKYPFLEFVSTTLNLQPDKKMEIDSTDELSMDILMEEAHPTPPIEERLFKKPPGPQRRGKQRVI